MSRSRPRYWSGSDDSGSASVWVLGCCALVALLAAAVLLRGLAAVARHQVESAAELAAVAGALQIGTSGAVCSAAARTALANGATLVRCRPVLRVDGRSGTVDVTVVSVVRLPLVGPESVASTARAAREIPWSDTHIVTW